MSGLRVYPVAKRSDWRAFLHFPWKIYRPDHPEWVPPLLGEQRADLDPRRGPFFRMGTLQCFLAEAGGEVVGRIAAIHNRRHLDCHEDEAGFLGYFECVKDPEVAHALFERGARWLRERGLRRIYGPVSPTINDESGILIEGFDQRPAIGNAYNPPYYQQLWEDFGFRKAKDMMAWLNRREMIRHERLEKVEAAARRLSTFTITGLPVDRLEEMVPLFTEIFREAWKTNFLALPLEAEEWRQLAKKFRPFLAPDLAYVAHQNGRPAGLFLGMRDLNAILHELDGRLFPTGWLRLRWGWKKVRRGRVFMMGVHPDFQGSGLPLHFVGRYFRRVVEDPVFEEHDFSWVWEDNVETLRVIERVGVVPYMTYRLYEKEL